MPRLVLATTNPGKIAELRALLAACDWEIVTPTDVGVRVDVDETGATYEENARLKALAYARAAGLPALADDSGLEVDALAGAPGVHSARFGGADMPHAEKIRLLLARLQDVPDERRGARFRAVIVVALPDGRTYAAEGVCAGRIARAPRGEGGFGYDPIFLVEGGTRTMAELTPAEKNRLSHRARAAAGACRILHNLARNGTST
jgi:XTP/dITP diphosphohydrolase